MKSLPEQDPTDPAGSNAEQARAWLSALADGQSDDADRACQAWRDSEGARRAWHAYHLIGDVMRSQELATSPARDAAFLNGLRDRLAAEPVVFAPQPLPSRPAGSADTAGPRRRQPWLLPAAAAAGFAFVAGALVVGRVGLPGSGESGPTLAATSATGAAQTVSNPVVPASTPRAGYAGQPRFVVSSEGPPIVLRDPLLDDYLRAHQLVRGGVPVAAPGGTLRPVDMAAPPAGQRSTGRLTESATGR